MKKIQLAVFYKNILIMFRGTVIAQVIAVLGAIYLAKLYGEEAYGFFGFFVSITSIVGIISTLQLDKCIITSKEEKESRNWFNFLLIIFPIITIICFFIFFVYSFLFDYKKQNESIFLLSLFGSIIISSNLIHESFFTFKKEFSIISNTKVYVTIFNIFLQFILFYEFSVLGLIIGFIVSQFLLFIYFFYKNRSSIQTIDIQEIKNGIHSNFGIIKFLLPSNIINSLANNIMPILILSFFGVKEAGVYFFSIKILSAPLFLISSSVSNVYFQKSAELKNKDALELLEITKKIVKTNILIMISFLLVINTIGIYLIDNFLGNQWYNLNIYILILSFLVLARSSFNPISSLIVVLDKNFIGLIFNCYLFMINLVAIYFGTIYNSIIYTVLILSFFGGIGYFLLLYYFFNQLKQVK